jgi:hypothetical protein
MAQERLADALEVREDEDAARIQGEKFYRHVERS